MFTFKFAYTDNSYQEYEHITKADYLNIRNHVVIESDDMLNHRFPTNCDIHLMSEKTSYIVPTRNVKFISVTKED